MIAIQRAINAMLFVLVIVVWGFLPQAAQAVSGATDLIGNTSSEVTLTIDTVPPVPVVLSKSAAGLFHTMAIKSDGTLWGWGDNEYGQIGDGTKLNKLSPVQIGSSDRWVSIATGSYHTMAIESDGTLWGWGNNQYGKLGDGTSEDKISPVQIGTDNTWVAVSAGNHHTIAIKSDGTLWGWGWNCFGQLGDGTRMDKLSPVLIGTENNWISISAGNDHTIALKSDGTLWAWGGNSIGQLGDGTTVDKLSPVQIGTDIWVSIAAGAWHSMALKSDGTLWAWGYNGYGQLGDGTNANKYSPVRVGRIGIDENWIAVETGRFHTIAQKSDDTLWAWGRNAEGQFGNGKTLDKTYPEYVGLYSPYGNRLVSIAAGGYHSLAVTARGDLLAWGSNNHGQVGTGGISERVLNPSRVLRNVTKNGNINIDNGISFTNHLLVSISYMVIDANGISEMQFSKDGITWPMPEPYAITKDWSLDAGDDVKNIYVKFKDSAGNWSAVFSSSVVLDTSIPSVRIDSPTPEITNDNTPILNYYITDETIQGSSVLDSMITMDGSRIFTLPGQSLKTLADGMHTLRLEATDSAGNTGFAEVSFTVDTAPPTVNISSPSAGTTKNNAPVLTYTVSDGTVLVKVDGVVVSKVSGNALDMLADGLHTVRVESKDAAGNTGSAEITFTVDTVLPAVSINPVVTPTNSNAQTVTGTREANATIIVSVNPPATAGPVSYPTATTWSCTLSSLVEGANNITVTATDVAGNGATATVGITFDSMPPAVGINPVATPTNVNAQTITGTREADAVITASVNTSATVGAVTYASATTWSCVISGLVEGVNNLTVTAKDAAANSATTTAGITYDSIAPTVGINPVVTPTNVNTQTVTGMREADAVITASVSTSATVGAVTYPTATTWSCVLSGLIEGANNITATATDSAHNSATAAVGITFDSVPPTVTISSVITPTKINAQTISGNRESGANITVTVNTSATVGAVSYPTSTTWICTISSFAQELNTITVTAKDAAANSATATAGITYDSIAPAVSINPVATPTNVNTQTITGTREADAVITASVNTSATVGSVTYPTATTWSFLITGLAEGANNITVTAKDAANNSATTTAGITYDSMPPTITINPVATPTKLKSQTITGTMQNGATVTVKVNTSATVGTASYPTSATWSCTITNLVYGVNNITATARDGAGNTAAATTSITERTR